MAWPCYRNTDQNPYCRYLYDSVRLEGWTPVEFSIRAALRGRYDVLHMHWPDALLKNVGARIRLARLLALTAVLIYLKIALRKPVIWTAHNTSPHGHVPNFYIVWLHQVLSMTVSSVICLNSETRESLLKKSAKWNNVPMTVIWHGPYDLSDFQSVSAAEARESLGIPNRMTVGLLGTLAPYKGLDRVVEWLERNREQLDGCNVLIAGMCEDDYLVGRLHELSESGRIAFRPGWIDAADLYLYHRACDKVICAYDNMENSGAVIYALSAGTRVAVPASPSMRDLANFLGEESFEWLAPRPQPISITVADHAHHRPVPAMLDFGMSWSDIASRTRDVYEAAGRR